MRVLGIDGCRKGWLGVVLDGGCCAAVFAPRIGELADRVGPVDGIGIDMPIGLLEQGLRTADAAARAQIGRLGRSVFPMPARSALLAEPFAAAVAESTRLSGTGLSQHAYALRAKILEVEQWLPGSGPPVWEVHPEVSFTVASGTTLTHSKRTWAGFEERRAILAGQGLAAGTGRSFPARPDQFSPGGRPIAIWA